MATLDERLAAAYITATNNDEHAQADLFLTCRELVKESVELARAVTAQDRAKEILHICREEPRGA